MFRVRDLLSLPIFKDVRLVAGKDGLDRIVRWVHVVDLPDVDSWIRGGELLLTTGASWPRDFLEQRRLMKRLDAKGLSALLIATGRFFSEVPPGICQAGDEFSLPVFDAPFSLRFIDITEVVHRAILELQWEKLTRVEEAHRHLTRLAVSSGSFEALLGFLREFIAGQAEIVDTEGRHIAGDRITTEDALAFPIVAAAKEVAGQLLVVPGVLLTDIEVRVLEQGATVAALHIMRQRALVERELRARRSFVDDLLFGEVDEAFLEEARLQGFEPDHPYRVVVALSTRKERDVRAEWLAGRLRRLLEGRGIRLFFTTLSGTAILVLPAQIVNRSLFHRLADELQAAEVHFFVGGPVLGRHVRESFQQARSLVSCLSDLPVVFFEEAHVLRVLRATPPELIADLVAATLGSLAAAGPHLVETVETYLTSGFSQLDTARRLGIHRNTLRARLRRAEVALGRSLHDPEVLAQLALAFTAQKNVQSKQN